MMILERIIISSFLLFACVSCKKNIEKKDNKIKIIYVDKPYVNKEYIGKIIMKYPLDTLKIENNDLRSTSFLLGKFKTRKSVEFLEKIKDSLDVFGKIEDNNDTIYFKYKFTETGVFYLEGLVEDLIYLDKYYSPNSRLISDITKISEKVIVLKK